MTRIVLVVVLLMACLGTRSKFVPTNPPPRPLPRTAARDVVVFAGSRPIEPFIELGLVEAHRSHYFWRDHTHELIAALRERAAAAGCDAIIIHPDRDGDYSAVALSGVCIVYPWPAAASYREGL